jgi:phosphoglycolate phosphatase
LTGNACSHLFFDLDGTLTDPAPGIGACFLHAARFMGCTSFAESDVRRFIGPPLRAAFVEMLGTEDEATIELAVRSYRERFSTLGLFESSVYPGIPRVLDALRRSFRLCVVTSKPEEYADRIVDHFELRPYFSAVYGARLSGERSAKAELLAHATAVERVDATRACMIGDRHHDIVGAKAHGMPCIGVTWGYGTRSELECAGADYLVNAVDDLLPVARSLGA